MQMAENAASKEPEAVRDSTSAPSTSQSDALARRLIYLERQRGAVARQLRDETAQVLSYAILELAAAEGRESEFETDLKGLQEALRIELHRLLGIVSDLTAPAPHMTASCA
jgi:hypothetical protein